LGRSDLRRLSLELKFIDGRIKWFLKVGESRQAAGKLLSVFLSTLTKNLKTSTQFQAQEHEKLKNLCNISIGEISVINWLLPCSTVADVVESADIVAVLSVVAKEHLQEVSKAVVGRE
jgi:hypothetical protein